MNHSKCGNSGSNIGSIGGPSLVNNTLALHERAIGTAQILDGYLFINDTNHKMHCRERRVPYDERI